MNDDELDRCACCSFLTARECKSGQLIKTAEIGTHTIYACEAGGLTFCVKTENEDGTTCDEDPYAEEIACAELNK